MSSKLPQPEPGAIIYEDKLLYACLASYPITKGHVVIIWKDNVSDLHCLNRNDYEHLMEIVDNVRNAMMQTLKVEKVYLLYMDEVKHVHWHLVPRYNQKGFNVLLHKPKKLTDFSLAKVIEHNLIVE